MMDLLLEQVKLVLLDELRERIDLLDIKCHLEEVDEAPHLRFSMSQSIH